MVVLLRLGACRKDLRIIEGLEAFTIHGTENLKRHRLGKAGRFVVTLRNNGFDP
jgi:hypothetical protein